MADDDPKTTEELAMSQPAGMLERKRTRRGAGARRGRQESRPLAGRTSRRGNGRKTEELPSRGKRVIDEARRWAEDARNAAPNIAKGLHLPSAPSLETLTEANPIILGAVGLGIGVIIGALLPRDALSSSMHGLGLTSGTGSTPSRQRSSSRSRPKK